MEAPPRGTRIVPTFTANLVACHAELLVREQKVHSCAPHRAVYSRIKSAVMLERPVVIRSGNELL